MSSKMVAETWKHHKRRKDLDHSRLFRRLDRHGRMLHMMECAPCLQSALDAVSKLRREIMPYIREYERYGTVGGRLHSHNSFKEGNARTDDPVSGEASAQG